LGAFFGCPFFAGGCGLGGLGLDFGLMGVLVFLATGVLFFGATFLVTVFFGVTFFAAVGFLATVFLATNSSSPSLEGVAE